MPTVGPSDGGYQYYQQNIDDLEDEVRAEAKKARKNENENVRELEDRYKQNIRDHDDELAETLKNYKHNADETIAHERAASNGEIDRIKHETYDKWGRYNGQEADVVKRELEETKAAADKQYDKDQKAQKDAEAAYHARLADYTDDNSRQMEKSVAEARDSAETSFEQAAQENDNQFNQYKKESEKKTQDLDQRRMDEMNELRRRYDLATDSMKRDYDRGIDRLNETNRARFTAHERSRMHDQTDQTKALNKSHADETAGLRDQIKELQYSEGDYMKSKDQGTHDAVAEFEDEWRQKLASEQQTYSEQIDDLKQKTQEQQDYLNARNTDNMTQKDRYYSGVIRKQNLDSHLEQKRAENTYLADRKDLETRMKQEREMSNRVLERKIADANQGETHALDEQAQAFQDTMGRQNTNDREQISSLEKELQYRKTSADDTSAISPALEDKLRRSVAREYEKTMGVETKKNRATVDSIQKQYADRLQDSVLEHESLERKMNQESAQTQHRERADFLDHLRDSDEMKNLSLRNKDSDNQRMAENMTRNYALALNRQRGEADTVLNDSRNDASTRLSSQRQEAEFASRMATRSFTIQQNELIRDYDKKLADQKMDFDTKYDDLKIQHQTATREAERRQKQQLDEVQRSYEQRLAQTEAQHKERERYLTQSYQDELEKVRRSNALLIQKKS